MKLFDSIPRHGGEAFNRGYAREWNPYWTLAKRAAWFEQFDHAKVKLLERPAVEPQRISDEYAKSALDRIRSICAYNDINNTSRPLLLSGTEVATLSIYILSLRSVENDYIKLSESLLDSVTKQKAISVKISGLERQLRRNVTTVFLAVIMAFSFGVMLADAIK